MLKRLRKYMTPARLKLVMEGLFNSKMIYGMTVWGRVWNIPGDMDEEVRPVWKRFMSCDSCQ